MPERCRRLAARWLIVVLTVTAGLVGGAGIAWARWSASGTAAAPPPLGSGSLDLTVNGQLLGRGGTTSIADLTLANAVPGSADAANITVGNAGTTALTVTVVPSASGALAANVQTTVVYGGTAAGATCTGGTTTPPVLAAGATTNVCVVLAVSSSAPTSAQGQSGTVALELTATQAGPAQVWTDTGRVTGGSVTTWALTNVACPAPTWGAPHVLSWNAPSGSSYTVSLTSNPEPAFLSSWSQASPRPGQPLTTTATSAQWGIATSNPIEDTNFTGTWTLTATPPAPTGGWTATRSGTWRIDYNLPFGGFNECVINP